jgi:N-acetylmuramic acid 6-phosphate etherase
MPDKGDPEELRQQLSRLTTEQVREDLRDLDTLPTSRLVEIMNERDRAVPEAIESALPSIAAAIDAIVERMRSGGRLVYIGAGTPGRLGVLDASEIPPTFNTESSLVVGIIAGGDGALRHSSESAEDDPAGGERDLGGIELGAADSVVGISASGRTPYVAGALAYTRSRGALSVALSCNADAENSRDADHAIEVVVGPEFVAGSTRLGAGTAQKLVLNMISTIVMVRLGKTYGNIMVDLRASNEKLRARAERAVMLVTECTAAEATAALDEADGSVKTAILMILRGLGADGARARLDEAGSLREALAD